MRQLLKRAESSSKRNRPHLRLERIDYIQGSKAIILKIPIKIPIHPHPDAVAEYKIHRRVLQLHNERGKSDG